MFWCFLFLDLFIVRISLCDAYSTALWEKIIGNNFLVEKIHSYSSNSEHICLKSHSVQDLIATIVYSCRIIQECVYFYISVLFLNIYIHSCSKVRKPSKWGGSAARHGDVNAVWSQNHVSSNHTSFPGTSSNNPLFTSHAEFGKVNVFSWND